MPPTGRPFQKGQSGNPGGRRALPRDVREALNAAGPRAIARLIEIAEDADKALRSDPKTYAIHVAAVLRVIELNYGKNPEPPGLEEEAKTVESTATVERVQPSPQHLASVLAVLRRVDRLPDGGGAGGTGSGADS